MDETNLGVVGADLEPDLRAFLSAFPEELTFGPEDPATNVVGLRPDVHDARDRRAPRRRRTPDTAPCARRPVRHRPASAAQLGITGSRRSGMPASVGVRSPLRWLHP